MIPLPRTFAASHLNAVANDPSVRPGLGMGAAPMDFTGPMADASNLAFADERGGFFIERLDPVRYELHTLLRPGSRGRTALVLAADVIRRVFAETDCQELVTRVPGNLPGADLMARRAGFREVWTMAETWPGPEGMTSLRLFAMTLDEWMLQDAALIAEGEAFHALMRAAADAAGSNQPLHPHEDDVHERAAGMASLMAKAGNVRKALYAYNRWARLAGYLPLTLVSEHPAIINVGNALVQSAGGRLEVLQWSPQQ